MTRFASILVLLLAPSLVLAQPSAALAAAVQDARRLPASVRSQTRYLDLGTIPADRRADAVRTLNFHANQLSKNSELVPLRRVTETMYAAVLEDYSWSAAVWEKLADIDPYFHVHVTVVVREVEIVKLWPGGPDRTGTVFAAGTPFKVKEKQTVIRSAPAPWLDPKAINELILLTGSNAPIVRADWWFVQTARQTDLNSKESAVGYYSWLGIKNRADFQKLARFREQDSLDIGKEIRATLERSGVAINNRQIVRLQALTGAYWVTLDATASTDKRNAVRNLARGDYLHDAEEVYLTASNGLFYYFAGDAKGVKQNVVPQNIAPTDDSPLRTGTDGGIYPALRCVTCHTEGLRPIDDWARRTLKSPVGIAAADYAKYVEIRRAYFSNLDKQLARDRQVYVDALKEINGLSPADNAKAFAHMWDSYVLQDLSTKEIAFEWGVTEAAFVASLKAYAAAHAGQIDLVLSGILQNPQSTIRREQAEELWPELGKVVGR